MKNSYLNNHFRAKIFAVAAISTALLMAISGFWYFATVEGTLGNGSDTVGIELGQIAPDFILVDIDGNTSSLGDHTGQVVILDLMATWCPPCITEMEHLSQIFGDYSASVVIMSIDVDPTETDEMIRQFKIDYGRDWIFASGSSVGITYELNAIPTIYIVDKLGHIAYKNVGLTPASVLEAEIENIL